MFICDMCGKQFTSRDNIIKHFLIHGNRNYTCGTCGASFKTSGCLARHRKAHANIVCGYCNEEFLFLKAYKSHHRAEHSKLSKKYQMVKLVGNEFHLIEKEPDPAENDPFVCMDCGKTFISKAGIKNHNCLEPIIRECEHCNKKFKSKKGLETHKCPALGDIYPTVTCQQCQKTFKSKKGFDNHKCQNASSVSDPDRIFRMRRDDEIECEIEVDVIDQTMQ